MYIFGRNKLFVFVFYLTVLLGFISIIYKLVNQSLVNIEISISTIVHPKSNISFSYKNDNKCIDRRLPSHRTLSSVIRYDDILDYIGFVIQSHSLYYCSVPKVATRTLLLFITYLHIRDDLIPLLTNNSRSDIINVPYLKHTILSSIKNDSQLLKVNTLSLLQLFLSELLLNNSLKIDLWSIYQQKVFPYIRLRSLSNPSILFSSNYIRVIFVRHPFERLASAYIDKISSLNNKPFTLYDNIRRSICRKYSSIYLTNDQQNFYRTQKGLIKQIDEPCQYIIPTFEHFIEYLISDSIRDDVHWKPYSRLCHVCLFKYNFIGKFEIIENDLRKLLTYVGLNSNNWIKENYFKNGKTKENYKLMFSKLNNKLICFLKYFYKYDLDLFNYHIKDYLNHNKTIQCSAIYFKKLFKTNFL